MEAILEAVHVCGTVILGIVLAFAIAAVGGICFGIAERCMNWISGDSW